VTIEMSDKKYRASNAMPKSLLRQALIIVSGAVLLSLFLTAGLAAQSKGSSIMTYAGGNDGTSRTIAEAVRGDIGIGLLKQFPCVDQMDDDMAAAIVGVARWKQLLTGELDEKQLTELAGAVGARYIMTVVSTTMPNGETSTSVVVIDSDSAKIVASRRAPPAKSTDAIKAAKQLVTQILGDLANMLKGRCDKHWVGTISYSKRKEISKTESFVGYSSGQGIPNVKVTVSTTETLDDSADITLQAMALGSSGDSTMAQVVQRYHYLKEVNRSETGTTPCREPGRNTYRKEVTGDSKEVRTEDGQNVQKVSVDISVSPSGEYRIKIYKIDTVPTKGKFETSGNLMGCTPNPFSSIRETTGVGGVGYMDLTGKFDPKKGYELKDKLVKGDLVNGQETWTWNLKLVDPKAKK